LPEQHRERIFHVRNPQSERTFLADGEVTGTWRYESGRVRLEPSGAWAATRVRRSRTRPSG
jgi:hypothetical protein